MRKTNIESTSITNSSLFELAQYKAIGIPAKLAEFLQEKEFPWLALGSALKSFIQKEINSIKKENRIQGTIHPLAIIENKEEVVICEGAVVEPLAYIIGPAFIGPNAVVRHGAYLRGNVYLGEKGVIGHTTECKNLLMLPKAKAAHFNYLGLSAGTCPSCTAVDPLA